MSIRLIFPRVVLIGALLMLVASLQWSTVSSASLDEAGSESVPNWGQIMDANQERLAHVDSDQAARDVFVAALGRAASLHDVAGTLAVQGLSTKVAAELMLPQITNSAQRFVAALAVWRLTDRMMQALDTMPARAEVAIAPSQIAWATANGPFPSLDEAIRRWDAADSTTPTAVAVGRAAQEASRQAMEEWWRLKTWKERVRNTRGQSRLCGTWLWVIHNHQRHHEEQKFSLIFPPPGTGGTPLLGLTETVILGDVVYLRWEREGKVQEDSLLFSKEGQRLEGTFINSQGGWGSITGKRTASCTSETKGDSARPPTPKPPSQP